MKKLIAASAKDFDFDRDYENYLYKIAFEVERILSDRLEGAVWTVDEDGLYLEFIVPGYDDEFTMYIPRDEFLYTNEIADQNTIELELKARLDNITSPYKYVKQKEVIDDNGFTDIYTMYYDKVNDRYVFMYGDPDLYPPEEGYFDWECDTREQAEDWFNSYE